ncbi:MAG TPA: DUF58 domain-containing protein [Pirellulales bacterium]|jgi:uncharacterized protein (DUF58 family)|nr:DUF58 domain-containing protein [Pirellulales bacterium]
MSEDIRRHLIEGEQAGARYRLAAPRSAPQGTAGSQLGRAAGESMEFMEHRDYQPGDDLRRMNWSAYARSDRLVVKVFQQEVCPHFDLVIDGSRSMMLEGTQKLRASLGLAAALAMAAENSGYSRRVYQTQNGCHPIRGGSDRPAAWQGLQFDARHNPAESFRALPPAWRPRGIRVIVSDFLWLGDPLEVLNPMADRAAAVVVIQILAAEDMEPVGRGNQRLLDSESGKALEVYVDASGQDRYRQNLARHQQSWHMAARKVGATFISLIAEDLCPSWDLSPLVRAEALTV